MSNNATHRVFSYGTLRQANVQMALYGHPILRPGEATESVSGAYLELTGEELSATDAYEVSDYVRKSVTLLSGAQAFVYVAENSLDKQLG